MDARVASKYVGLLDLDPVATSASVRLVVKDSHGREAERAAPRSGTGQPTAGVPIVRAPDPAGVPDLQPLPSWGISTRHSRQGDFLSFGANVLVAGNGPLVVEGFRREGEDVMDAYQYFYENGEPVGRERVGEMALVIISCSPGHRRVEVPPWHGIDTEAWLQRYGSGPFVG